MPANQGITLRAAIDKVIAMLDGPMPKEEFIQRVLAIRPSTAKNPKSNINTTLRYEHVGFTVAYLDRDTLVPLKLAMRGVRFRIQPSPEEVEAQMLRVSWFKYYYRYDREHTKPPRLAASDGQPLDAPIVTLTTRVPGILGALTHKDDAFQLDHWYAAYRFKDGDSILVTILDWDAARFGLEFEPAGQRREEAITQRNQELADRLFEILEAAHDERVFPWEILPTAYIRLADPRGYPGDHWQDVLYADGRMGYDGIGITYADRDNPFDDLLGLIMGDEEEEPDDGEDEPLSPEQAQQVYRFKATLPSSRNLWRVIEIQGGQTLADFDKIMRAAFKHDTWDHLGGFWKRIRRGTGKRYREVSLGTVDPLGGGEGSTQRIAEFDLRSGDELQYVYDFGDWIEHHLTLEDITPPQLPMTYPRIVAQNEPRPRYCERCKAQGLKTIATWLCLECSNRQQRDVLVCEDCLEAAHADHQADEMLY